MNRHIALLKRKMQNQLCSAIGNRQAYKAAHHRKHHAFGQRLPHQPSARRAQR